MACLRSSSAKTLIRISTGRVSNDRHTGSFATVVLEDAMIMVNRGGT
jgi:hypothetical protein